MVAIVTVTYIGLIGDQSGAISPFLDTLFNTTLLSPSSDRNGRKGILADRIGIMPYRIRVRIEKPPDGNKPHLFETVNSRLHVTTRQRLAGRISIDNVRPHRWTRAPPSSHLNRIQSIPIQSWQSDRGLQPARNRVLFPPRTRRIVTTRRQVVTHNITGGVIHNTPSHHTPALVPSQILTTLNTRAVTINPHPLRFSESHAGWCGIAMTGNGITPMRARQRPGTSPGSRIAPLAYIAVVVVRASDRNTPARPGRNDRFTRTAVHQVFGNRPAPPARVVRLSLTSPALHPLVGSTRVYGHLTVRTVIAPGTIRVCV